MNYMTLETVSHFLCLVTGRILPSELKVDVDAEFSGLGGPKRNSVHDDLPKVLLGWK
jgi:hypothetical protein